MSVCGVENAPPGGRLETCTPPRQYQLIVSLPASSKPSVGSIEPGGAGPNVVPGRQRADGAGSWAKWILRGPERGDHHAATASPLVGAIASSSPPCDGLGWPSTTGRRQRPEVVRAVASTAPFRYHTAAASPRTSSVSAVGRRSVRDGAESV